MLRSWSRRRTRRSPQNDAPPAGLVGQLLGTFAEQVRSALAIPVKPLDQPALGIPGGGDDAKEAYESKEDSQATIA